MPRAKVREKEEIKWVALLQVSWPGGSHEIRSFDAAWHLMLDKGLEFGTANSRLLRFVRKDD